MASLNTATGREETADDAGDVAADVECLRVIHPDALYTKTETADAETPPIATMRRYAVYDLVLLRNRCGAYPYHLSETSSSASPFTNCSPMIFIVLQR